MQMIRLVISVLLFCCVLPVLCAAERTILVLGDSLSAAYGIDTQAGWVNLLGMVAMEAAYDRGEAWLDALLPYLESNRDYAFDFINNKIKGVKMAKPEGTYLAWLDCREAGIEGKPDKFFQEQAKVAMNDGAWFGKGGEGFVRLNFGCPRSMLEESLNRMKEAIETL